MIEYNGVTIAAKTGRSIVFPQPLSSGRCKTTGITVVSLHCRGKITPLMEEVRKVKSQSDRNGDKTRAKIQAFT